MAAKSKSREPRSAETNLAHDTEERIRRRAYALYEQRVRVDGFDLDQMAPSGGRDNGSEEATEGQTSKRIK